MKIIGKIERCNNIHRNKAIIPPQRRYRRAVLITDIQGLPRDHIRIPSNEVMIDFYKTNEFNVGKYVEIQGEIEHYTDTKGDNKQSITPYSIKYVT